MGRAPVVADRGAFVAAWVAALEDAGYVAMTSAQLGSRVAELTASLVASQAAPVFSAEPAERVGAALVDLRLTTPAALACTIQLVGEHLPAIAATADTVRLAQIQAAVSAGFAGAMQQRIFREQERIRRAELDARRDAEAALRASEARFRAMFTQAAVGIGISDTDGNIVDVNEALARMLGYRRNQLRQVTVDELWHDDEAPKVHRPYEEMLAGLRDRYHQERRLRRVDGSALWTDLTVSLVRDDDGEPQYLLAMVEDITERRLFQDTLRYQANHDPLTGLGNRALFTEHLHAAFTAGPQARIGVCYLDLDGFKVINDSLGHDIGDRLLVVVAQRLDELVRGEGRTVARMGGDEFVVLVENSTGLAELTELAQRILDRVSEPVLIGGHRLAVSASIGIVERCVEGVTPADTMRDADITLYWAKTDGRNRHATFDADRNAREIARFTLSAQMPLALEHGEFYVEYQPIVRLDGNSLVGVEALVRWAHPEFGRLGPDRFISLAEETGLIVPLGLWVLREACEQGARWLAEVGERAPQVSVNLSARQTAEPGLVADIVAVLRETGLPPTMLQLELTESAIMGTTGEPLEMLRQLSAMGICIAIDDFGTGYSNLAYLRHLPVHAIKLAGSFMEGHPADAPIVSTLVTLSHALGHKVIAEGVETGEQAQRLRDIGCDCAQGWLFAKPSGPEDIDRWF